MAEPIPDVLLKAADVIETRGWWRGGYAPPVRDIDLATCPVCVLAAINVATGREPDTDLYASDAGADNAEAAIALAKHLGFDPVDAADVVDAVGERWNDEVAESAEQVIAALRECAASLKAGA